MKPNSLTQKVWICEADGSGCRVVVRKTDTLDEVSRGNHAPRSLAAAFHICFIIRVLQSRSLHSGTGGA